MATINENTIRSDIFVNFLKTLKDNLSNPKPKVTNSFTNDATNFPQIVITLPKISKTRAKFGSSRNAYLREGTIDIEVYTKTKKQLSMLIDEVDYLLAEHMDELGIVDFDIGLSNDISFTIEGTNIHSQTLPITLYIGEL